MRVKLESKQKISLEHCRKVSDLNQANAIGLVIRDVNVKIGRYMCLTH